MLIGELSFSFRKLCPKPEPVGMQHMKCLKIWTCTLRALNCAKRLTASYRFHMDMVIPVKAARCGKRSLTISANSKAPSRNCIGKAKVRTLYIRQQSERPSHSFQWHDIVSICSIYLGIRYYQMSFGHSFRGIQVNSGLVSWSMHSE